MNVLAPFFPATGRQTLAWFTAWMVLAVAVTSLDYLGASGLESVESPTNDEINSFGIAALDLVGCVAGLLVTCPLLIAKGFLLFYCFRINPNTFSGMDSEWNRFLFNAGFDLGLCLILGVFSYVAFFLSCYAVKRIVQAHSQQTCPISCLTSPD